VEVAPLCDAGREKEREREMAYATAESSRDGKAGSREALGSLSAHGAFKPADPSAAAEINNYPIWKKGWGVMLVAKGIHRKVGIEIQVLRGCGCIDFVSVLG
jgi:hypothetical protein